MFDFFNKKIKKMNVFDIGFVKLVCMIAGAIIGAYISDFIKDNIIIFAAVGCIIWLFLLVKVFKK